MPPRVQPGNPEWVEWVEQLAAKSEERGEKSAQTFKRAAQSLRSCPLAFQHPEDALQLKGVGPKIVQHITRKLKEKCEAEGVEMPDRVPSPSKPRGRPAASKSKKRPALDDDDPTHDPRYARRLKAMGIDPADAAAAGPSGQQFAPGLTFQAYPDGHAWNRPQTPEDDEPCASKGKGKGKGKAKAADGDGEKEKKERAYIPRQNSGAYAILLALYKCSAYGDRHNDVGEGGAGSAESWVTKQMIMDVGQEFSTTPFDTGTANRGGNATGGPAFTYNAWSGNKTLQEKGLMVANNKRPIKYCLTAAGYTLAEKLAPSAGIAVHEAPARSSSAAHPSSPGAKGATHPSSSGGGIGGDPFASLGRGNVVGGPGSGVRPPQGIHAAPRRRRSETPEFLRVPADDPARAATEEAEDPGLNFEDDDPEFAAQMRQALALSRHESQSFSSSPAPARATGAALDPAAVARRAAGGATSSKAGDAALARLMSSSGASLDGRKAASGMYAVKVARPEKEPVPGGIGNYDAAFGYFYLTEDDARTPHRHLAEVAQSDDLQILYRIEYRTAQDLHPMVRGLVRTALLNRPEGKELPGGKTKEAYMKERVSAEKAPGFPDAAMRGGKAPAEEKGKGKEKERDPDPVKALLAGFKAPEKRSRDAMYEAPKEVRRLGADPGAVAVGGAAPSTSAAASGSSTRPVVGPSSASAFRPALASTAASTSTAAAAPARRPSQPAPSVSLSPVRPRPSASTILSSLPTAPRATSSQQPLLASFDAPPPSALSNRLVVNRHPLDPVRDLSSAASYIPPSFQPIVWPAGSFKVFLVVDSREGTREAGKRVELQEKMEREGVPCERRMLPLGDMLWVAKKWDFERDRPLQPGNSGGDVVLDAIVERKRLDDLCSSIIDGRYVGQKFRYKDSAISHRIYLIEKYDVAAQYEKFGKAIWTCKSQLQVSDGFFVHESVNFNDTVNWLKKRTTVMKEIYESSPLYSLPDTVLDRQTYLPLQHSLRTAQPQTRYLTSYASFCELNKPDAALTLRSQWASLIQRVNGVSAEKAVQFLSRWETPGQFYREACAHEGEVAAENEELDREEAESGKKKKAKRRKIEDFVVEELGDGGTRGIKGKVGSRIWEVFMSRGRYPAA